MTQRLNHPQIFVNLPVADLAAAQDFYSALGWEVNEEFTDEKASSVQASDTIFVMLLTREFFSTFHPKETASTDSPREVITALSVDSNEDVDEMLRRAREAGAHVHTEPHQDEGMYIGAFSDPDGHAWEIFASDWN